MKKLILILSLALSSQMACAESIYLSPDDAATAFAALSSAGKNEVYAAGEFIALHNVFCAFTRTESGPKAYVCGGQTYGAEESVTIDGDAATSLMNVLAKYLETQDTMAGFEIDASDLSCSYDRLAQSRNEDSVVCDLTK